MAKRSWKPKDEVLVRGRIQDLSPDGEWAEIVVEHTDSNAEVVVYISPADLLPAPDLYKGPQLTVEDVLEAAVEITFLDDNPKPPAKVVLSNFRYMILDRARQRAERPEATVETEGITGHPRRGGKDS